MKTRKDMRLKRHERVRKKVSGTADRPRLAVMLSNRCVSAQLIDDTVGRTLAAAHSAEEMKGSNARAAEFVGKCIAEKAVALGIVKMAVDRGGFRFGSRVRALVNGAASCGLLAGSQPLDVTGDPDAVSVDEAKES